jgi:UTP--glucose-1-phosphate uridylyltransferase
MEDSMKLTFKAQFIFREAKVNLMVRKVIIPAAGLGNRLFPATKEQPKEMLPIFSKTAQGDMIVKPVVQLVFEELHNTGLREFCFVVGGGKRGIEDYFTPDAGCIRTLEGMGKNGEIQLLMQSRSLWIGD